MKIYLSYYDMLPDSNRYCNSATVNPNIIADKILYRFAQISSIFNNNCLECLAISFELVYSIKSYGKYSVQL